MTYDGMSYTATKLHASDACLLVERLTTRLGYDHEDTRLARRLLRTCNCHLTEQDRQTANVEKAAVEV